MTAEALVQSIIVAGDRLAEAVERELTLEDARPLVKDAAIRRLMAAAGLSATAAEKVVAQDAEYAEHQAALRAATVATIKARAYRDATIARAKLAAEFAEVAA